MRELTCISAQLNISCYACKVNGKIDSGLGTMTVTGYEMSVRVSGVKTTIKE